MSSAIQTQLRQLTINKSGWSPVKFGDVAFEPKESVKDALKEGIEHVVGLEHIEAGDIHLRRSNTIEESTTFTKKFFPGDVLFGRRRAYLKKAARADFTGICSGDITVMRVKENLLPELLPFIVNNDKFFDWAITHSAGGLSPRCKFKDLANYEFLLPPKAQQAEIAQLLWALDEVIQKETANLEAISGLKEGVNKKHFERYKKSSIKIGKFTEKVGSGVTPKGGSKVYQEDGVMFIRSQNVQWGDFSLEDVAYISEQTDEKMKSSRVFNNDVLLNITGASIGRCAVYPENIPANVNQHVCIIRTLPNRLDPLFLCEFLNSRYGQHQIQILQAGGNREGLNFGNIRLMRLPDYSFQQQQEIVKEYALLKSSKDSCRDKIQLSRSLQKSLVNQVF